MIAFIGGFGPTELIIILVICLLIFGVGKLPQVGDGLGKMISGFKKGVREADREVEEVKEAARLEVVEVEVHEEEQA
jgi:sec-independent protein translocase protein TatA